MPPAFDPNAHDVFLLRQQWTMVINRYLFSVPDAYGREGMRFAFVEQARFKCRPDTEHVLDRRLVLAAAVGMDALQAR